MKAQTRSMTCSHSNARQLGRDRAFLGSVSRVNENRAAHGCICITRECLACGAQQAVNINGLHEETSPWGPTRAEREAEARKAEREAREAIASVGTLDLTRKDGEQCLLRVDAEGYIVVPAGREWAEIERAVIQTEWCVRATQARELLLAAKQLRAEV